MLAAASGVATLQGRLLTPRAALAAPTIGGLTAVRGAMHVHTSFSEGTASLHSQLEEAARNGFDILWPTDHDWRMNAYQAPDVFHFTGLTEVVAGKSYTWKSEISGSLGYSWGGIVTTPVSPGDGAPSKGSLRVDATSSGTAVASRRFLMYGEAANKCHRTNLTGQTIEIDVLPAKVGRDAWAEILVTLSYRPATGGRPAGAYKISYRIGTSPASHSGQGLLGTVTIPAPTGAFSTVTLDPASDAARLWPDTVAGDNALVDLRLGVTSRLKVPASAYFGHLRFRRARVSGDQPLLTCSELAQQYGARYTGLTIGRGVEVSGASEHANWFGGEQHLIDHAVTKPADLIAYAAAEIHGSGGLASLNHPFGSGTGALATPAQQVTKRQAVAKKFLDRQLCGVDIVETGYRQRSGMGIETHLALFDTFVRSGYWVTATGVNDNHGGTAGSWSKEPNRFYSTTWAATRTEDAALDAVRAGRVFVGELGAFSGYLDVSVDANRMGSVSINPGVSSRALTITAHDLPVDSTVNVVRGPVDYGNAVDPGTQVVARISQAAFSSGQSTTGIDTSSSCFVRVEVVSAGGQLVAFSNPLMMLQSEPPRGLPAHRRAPDSPAPV